MADINYLIAQGGGDYSISDAIAKGNRLAQQRMAIEADAQRMREHQQGLMDEDAVMGAIQSGNAEGLTPKQSYLLDKHKAARQAALAGEQADRVENLIKFGEYISPKLGSATSQEDWDAIRAESQDLNPDFAKNLPAQYSEETKQKLLSGYIDHKKEMMDALKMLRQQQMVELNRQKLEGQEINDLDVELAAEHYKNTGEMGRGFASGPGSTQRRAALAERLLQGDKGLGDVVSDSIAHKKGAGKWSAGTPAARTAASFSNMNKHADAYLKLTEAINNKDMRLVNSIANSFNKQLSTNPDRRELEVVADFIAGEAAKIAVGSGASALTDREEMKTLLDPSASYNNKVAAMRGLKRVTEENLGTLLSQYKVDTGRKDFYDRFDVPLESHRKSMSDRERLKQIQQMKRTR